jgi:hypothetical protein
LEYHVVIQANKDEAGKAGVLNRLLQPYSLAMIETALPRPELELWLDAQGDERPSNCGRAFKDLIKGRVDWVRLQIANSTTPSVARPPFGQQGVG